MKIYLFCPETGIYQGEDFSDNPPMRQGREELPAYATTVVPPSCRRGEVPVFSVAEDKWQIRPVSQALAGGWKVQNEQAGSFDEPRKVGRCTG